MDASDYKHVVLGLIFLNYISDRFLEHYEALEKDDLADPEERDEYVADNIFWVPKEARWPFLQASAKQATIRKLIDEAMTAKAEFGMGNGAVKAILVRVYEYFLGQFASAEGKKGGQFCTPQCIVRLLVAMIQPFKGRVFDPCCGSGGMFVQSEKFVEAHGGRRADLSIFGQESNYTMWRLANMNLAIRGIEANLGERNADSFHDDLHKDLKADFILANPPFNMSDCGGERLKDDYAGRTTVFLQ